MDPRRLSSQLKTTTWKWRVCCWSRAADKDLAKADGATPLRAQLGGKSEVARLLLESPDSSNKRVTSKWATSHRSSGGPLGSCTLVA